MPDGRLWLIRDTYAAGTAWAPRHAGKELQQARLGHADADLGAIRAVAEAQAARKTGDRARARRHEELAASYRAMREYYQQREAVLGQAMADRLEWENATTASRHLAVAADAELRRRHPGQKIEPLRSAEPAPVSGADQRHLPADQRISELATWIRDLVAQHKEFRARMDEGRDLMVPSQDPHWVGLGESFPAWRVLGQNAILQPPKPQITPSTTIL
jgi:hypothetical protein